MNFNYTNTVHKNLFKAVPLESSGAGFNCFKITIEEVIDSLFGGLYSSIKVRSTLFEICKMDVSAIGHYSAWTVNESELVANNLANEDEKDSLAIGSPFLFFNLTL